MNQTWANLFGLSRKAICLKLGSLLSKKSNFFAKLVVYFLNYLFHLNGIWNALFWRSTIRGPFRLTGGKDWVSWNSQSSFLTAPWWRGSVKTSPNDYVKQKWRPRLWFGLIQASVSSNKSFDMIFLDQESTLRRLWCQTKKGGIWLAGATKAADWLKFRCITHSCFDKIVLRTRVRFASVWTSLNKSKKYQIGSNFWMSRFFKFRSTKPPEISSEKRSR